MESTLFVDDHVVIASIGDSRAYRLRHAFLKQVTTDHIVHHEGLAELPIEDARAVRPLVQLLTRAVGNALSAEPDVHVEAIAEGDVLLFCSNGLSDALERHAMAEILLDADNLEVACDRVLEATTDADDDVTVVLVQPAPRESP
jgi:PPM family protein phosphatase